MKSIAILGLGHIGKKILLVMRNHYPAMCIAGYDLTTGHDLTDTTVLSDIIKTADTVICATPFQLNKAIATVCHELGKNYFDLTEDVTNLEFVKKLPQKDSTFVPQCGLAPGMVTIIANDMARSFDNDKQVELKIRVGALHNSPVNVMKYHPSWSVDGLVNEYCNPCNEIQNGEIVQVAPLTGLEEVTLNGMKFEAARTSGGIGDLMFTFGGRVKSADYKTLRWPGHWQYMQFLSQDLNMSKNKDIFIKLFKENLVKSDPDPNYFNDSVYIQITAIGNVKGNRIIRTYNKEIKCDKTDPHVPIDFNDYPRLDAISKATVYGLLYAFEEVRTRNHRVIGYMNQSNFELNRRNKFYDIAYDNS